jgi:hypothetical protein
MLSKAVPQGAACEKAHPARRGLAGEKNDFFSILLTYRRPTGETFITS